MYSHAHALPAMRTRPHARTHHAPLLRPSAHTAVQDHCWGIEEHGSNIVCSPLTKQLILNKFPTMVRSVAPLPS